MEISLIPFSTAPAIILIMTSFASKLLIVTAILLKSRYDTVTSVRTGLGMALAKGELSLVVAKVGQETGAVSSAVFL